MLSYDEILELTQEYQEELAQQQQEGEEDQNETSN